MVTHNPSNAIDLGSNVGDAGLGVSVSDCQRLLPVKEEYLSPTEAPKKFHLPDERSSITHKFTINDVTTYLTVGFYSDGKPGEILLRIQKEGTTLSGVLRCFAISMSMGLQCGIPLEWYIEKFKFVRFEPDGMTTNPEIRMANSIIDYIVRWMELKFCPKNT